MAAPTGFTAATTLAQLRGLLRNAPFAAGDTSNIWLPSSLSLDGEELVLHGGNVTIASASGAAIDALGASRVFNITSGCLSLQNVQLRQGAMLSGDGGCVHVGLGARLLLSNGAALRGCTATRGGAVFMGAGATVELHGASRIVNASARSHAQRMLAHGGGAFVGAGARLTLSSGSGMSQVSAVSEGSTAFGGAVYLDSGGRLDLTDSTISEAYAEAPTGDGSQLAYGGALYLMMAPRTSASLERSTISDVYVTSTTGEAYGAGAYLSGGSLHMRESRIETAHAAAASNMAWGGAVFLLAGSVAMR